MKKYKFKLDRSGFWDVYRDGVRICGGYASEEAVIIGLADYIQYGANLDLSGL